MTATEINSLGIRYDLSGAGPPVLFLNAHDWRAAQWARQRRALESHYRVLTFDTHSDAPVYPVSQLADDAVALLDHLDIDWAHVVGPSIGGLVAQEMALRHPERVRSLTLASAWPHIGPLHQITQPVLVLAGAEDTLMPPHLARSLAEALPNARFRQMPGAHGFLAEHSDLFNEVLLDFLAWLDAAEA